jgi:uncharacterized protein (TIGR00255 family)
LIRSMTGFGKVSCVLDGNNVSIEISSVNHRHLDFHVRMPHEWSALEPVLRDVLKAHIDRGKVNVSINRQRGTLSAKALRFDAAVAKGYLDAAKELCGLLETDESMTLATLAEMDGVFYFDEGEDAVEAIKEGLLESITEAVGLFNKMRLKEGHSLCEDLVLRLSLIRESLQRVEEVLPELGEQYTARLRERIDELVENVKFGEERVALEVALMADRGDVTEEVVRLKTHLEHADTMLNSDKPVGRELNFLSQEIQREINTLGSKLRSADVSKEVLTMKSELEKMREQIQNIE